jgi:hypothetical protein
MALRVGNEAKWKIYLASGLGVLALLLLVRTLFSLFGGSSPAPAPAPVQSAASVPPAAMAPAPAAAPDRASSPGGTPAGEAGPYGPEAIKLPGAAGLDPTLHPEVMAQAEATTYTGKGRNIFSQNSAAPDPIEKPVAPVRPQPTGPPPPPPPPPIELKFYGYSSVKGGARQIFLLHNDDIFIAREGDVVDRRYRVVAIHPFAVDVEDIPYHDTQSLPLTQN